MQSHSEHGVAVCSYGCPAVSEPKHNVSMAQHSKVVRTGRATLQSNAATPNCSPRYNCAQEAGASTVHMWSVGKHLAFVCCVWTVPQQ